MEIENDDQSSQQYFLLLSQEQFINLDHGSTIGQSDNSSITIKGASLLPYQIRFYTHAGCLFLMDFGGGQITFLNNVIIPHGNLLLIQPNDNIKVGGHKFYIKNEMPLVLEQYQSRPKEKIVLGEEKKVEKKEKPKTVTKIPEEVKLSFFQSLLLTIMRPFILLKLTILKFLRGIFLPPEDPGWMVASSHRRMIAFALDSLFTFLIVVPVINGRMVPSWFQTDFIALFSSLASSLKTDKSLQNAFSSFGFYYFTFYFLQTLGVFIRGTSFGQWICKIHEKGKFSKKRLRAFFRVILDFLLSPLIIFDFTCLLKLATLKEILSRSFFVQKVPNVKTEEAKPAEGKLNFLQKILAFFKKKKKDKKEDQAKKEEEIIKLSWKQPLIYLKYLIGKKIEKIKQYFLKFLKPPYHAPLTFMPRVLILISDISIINLLQFFFCEVLPFKTSFVQFCQNLGQSILKMIPWLREIFPEISLIAFFTFFFPFFLIQLIFNLCFGLSLSQLIIGVKSSGEDVNPLYNRLTAVLRCLLGFMTLPLFFIFELPSFFGSRTFKEVFSGNYFYRRGKFVFKVTQFTFPPLTFLLALYIPLLYNSFNIGTLSLERFPKGKSRSLASSQMVSPFYVQSLNLVLNFDYLESSALIPLFNRTREEMVQNKNIDLLPPDEIVKTYHYKTKRGIVISKLKGLSFSHLIRTEELWNPFFRIIESSLFEVTVQKKNSSKTSKKEFHFNTLDPEKLIIYIKFAFDFNRENFKEFANNFGPIVYGPLRLKKLILEYLNYRPGDYLGLHKFDGATYMIYVRKSPVAENLAYFIPLDEKNYPFIQMNFYKGPLKIGVIEKPEEKLALNIFASESGKGQLDSESKSVLKLAIMLTNTIEHFKRESKVMSKASRGKNVKEMQAMAKRLIEFNRQKILEEADPYFEQYLKTMEDDFAQLK